MSGIDRRTFFKGMAAGTAGMMLPRVWTAPTVAAEAKGTARVSFTVGTNRRAMMMEILKPFEEEIRQGIGDKQVVIKPNFVVNDTPLCATHVDAVRGVLDFLKPIYKKQIIIGESTISPSGTIEGYKNYGYLDLPKEYNIKLMDFNLEPATTFWITNEKRGPRPIDIGNPYIDDNNYFISLTRLKTHDTVVATMTLKNMVMGAPMNYYDKVRHKAFMHEGAPTGLNYNMFLIAQHVRGDLAILDGVEGMENNGPINGTPVQHGVALAGLDTIAVDRVGLELMGIPYEDVGYLQWCANDGMGVGDRSRITIIGGKNPADHVRKYKLHEQIAWQLRWKEGYSGPAS
jgi:uncharacterized protein (DUF362 family)